MRVVLDTCILKLATFPADNNASALIYELAGAGLIEAWVSPAILEEYADAGQGRVSAERSEGSLEARRRGPIIECQSTRRPSATVGPG